MSEYVLNQSEVEKEEGMIPVATAVPEEMVNELVPMEETANEEYYLEFSRPINFEGELYRGINLSGMDSLSGKDLTVIERAFVKTGVISSTPEMTVTYAKIVAAKVTGLPAEFFEDLPVREVIKVKSKVVSFFYKED